MLIAAFLIDVPNRVGGILTISSCVETEYNFEMFRNFQFMNLWINQIQFVYKRVFLQNKSRTNVIPS